MDNQMVTGNNPQEDSAKNLGGEGLQKLGQEARSQAPSFSERKQHLIDLMKTDEEFGMYIGKEYQPEFQGFDLTKSFIEREEMLYRKYYLICEGYKLPEVSGFRMSRKV